MDIPFIHPSTSYQPDGHYSAGSGFVDGSSIVRGFTGVVAPMLAIVTSFQTELEWWLRVGALLSGICVSVLSIVSLIRNMRK